VQRFVIINGDSTHAYLSSNIVPIQNNFASFVMEVSGESPSVIDSTHFNNKAVLAK
jgi:hypothetical protein